MTTNLSNFIFLLLCCGYVLGADINAVKKAALKKIQTENEKILNLTKTTTQEVEKTSYIIPAVTRDKLEYGFIIHELTEFEVNQTYVTAINTLRLMNTTNGIKIFNCIFNTTKINVEYNRSAYKKYFTDVVFATEKKAKESESKEIKTWTDGCTAANKQYAVDSKKATDDVNKSTTEAAVNTAMSTFDKAVQKAVTTITGILARLSKIHIDFEKNLYAQVVNVKGHSRLLVDDNKKNITACFTKKY